MGPAPKGGVYHKPREEDFTDYWRHESQTSRKRYYASKIGDGGDRERKRKRIWVRTREPEKERPKIYRV